MTRDKTVSKILELKEFNRSQLEAAIKKAQERLDHEQQKLDALNGEYRRTSDTFAEKQAKGAPPVQEMEIVYTFLKHLGRQIEHQNGVVAACAAEREKQMRSMIEAYKEQRLFEIMHHKIRRKEVHAALRSEQKEADYQYLSRKGRSDESAR